MMNSFLSLIILGILCLSCKEKHNEVPLPKLTEKSIVSVDVLQEIKSLHGNEVGININYLMDDSFLPGMTYHSTITSLKETGVKLLRYPGGEKSDNYLFSTSPYDKSQPSAAYCNWPSRESRFFNEDKSAKSLVLDFDEYMDMCKQVGATPFVVVAYDAMYSTSTCGEKPTRNQLIRNAVEWVRYANIKKNYNVKLWMIGNESWNDPDYNGKVSPQQYAIDIAQFADSMRKIDPSIKIIANGDQNWWQPLLESNASSKIDYLAVSNYLPWNVITSYDSYSSGTSEINVAANQAIEGIKKYAKTIDKSRLQVILSEYSSNDWTKGWPSINNLGHALCTFQQLADAIIKPEVYAACLWNTRWVNNGTTPYELNDAFDSTGKINASGKVLAIFGNNLYKSMVKATSTSSKIMAYATYDKTNNFLNVFLLNKGNTEQEVKFDTANFPTKYDYQLWNFKGSGIVDTNPAWANAGAVSTGSSGMTVLLSAYSITMLQIKDIGKF